VAAELEQQARLAHARLAEDEDHLPASRLDLGEPILKQGQLALAPDERGEPAFHDGLEATAHRPRRFDAVRANG